MDEKIRVFAPQLCFWSRPSIHPIHNCYYHYSDSIRAVSIVECRKKRGQVAKPRESIYLKSHLAVTWDHIWRLHGITSDGYMTSYLTFRSQDIWRLVSSPRVNVNIQYSPLLIPSKVKPQTLTGLPLLVLNDFKPQAFMHHARKTV